VDHSSTDVTARIARLFIYPIKSCAGIEVQEALLLETGLEFDRAWMVVDEHHDFVTQRELPRMALIKPHIRTEGMVLQAPGMLALHIGLDVVEASTRVRVWEDDVRAFDMGAVAAQWFSDFLGQKLRLVRFGPGQQRLSSLKWTHGIQAPNQFADGFPLLVTSEASVAELNVRLQDASLEAVSVERFRANLVLSGIEAHDEDRLDVFHFAADEGGREAGGVQLKPVKPCARCPIPDIDPVTATSSHGVGDTLQTYRQDPRMNGAITFGMNAIVLSGAGQRLRVGQRVSADYKFD
jgi:uncharacterized protein